MNQRKVIQSHFLQASSMKASGEDNINMVLEFKNGQMAPIMRVNGLRARLMGMANLHMQMEISMKDNGKMIRQMVMEYIYIAMEQDIKDIGKMTYSMAMEHSNGMMEVYMKDYIN